MLKSIKGKLLAAFLGVITVVVISGVVSLYQIGEIGEKTDRFVGELWGTADLVMESNITVQEHTRDVLEPSADLDRRAFAADFHQMLVDFEEEYLSSGLPEEQVQHTIMDLKALDAAFEKPLMMYGQAAAAMEEADAAMGPLFDTLRANGKADLTCKIWEGAMLFNDVLIVRDVSLEKEFEAKLAEIKSHPDFSLITAHFTAYERAGRNVFAVFREEQGARDEYVMLINDFLEDLGHVETAFETEVVDPEAMATQQKVASVKVAQIVSIILSVVISLVIAWIMAGRISRPLVRTAAVIAEMEKGHLEQRIELDQEDEVGRMARALDSFADTLQHEVVGCIEKAAAGDLDFDIEPRDAQDTIRGSIKRLGVDLNRIVGGIRSAGDQIASGSQQVADAAQSLSQGSTESAASLQQVSASMTEIHSQTEKNSENAGTATQNMVEAKDIVGRTMKVMADMSQAMGDIDTSSQEISKINKVIDDIAFQTNLLALNAAVEAARAGQHGKGFAVVAEEVRTLAGRSAKAARETSGLVEETLAKVAVGSEFITKLEESFGEVAESAGKVAVLVEEIADQSRQQTDGISEINTGLVQIDQVTQGNTANAEESASAAEELSGQAEEMRDLLARFRLKADTEFAGMAPQAAAPRPAKSHESSHDFDPVISEIEEGIWG